MDLSILPAFATPAPLARTAPRPPARSRRLCSAPLPPPSPRARVSAPPRTQPRRARPNPPLRSAVGTVPLSPSQPVPLLRTPVPAADEELRPRLLARAAYLGPVALHKVHSALDLADAAAAANNASSASLSHNLAVADICVQLGMDCDTVCAAVLRNFAGTVGARAVDAAVGGAVLTILSVYDTLEEIVMRAEDAQFNGASYAHLRELVLLAARDEHRALSLRLAASVVDARALRYVADAKHRTLLARRTMYLDAPLANQLGMWYMQSELEENAFRHLHLLEYQATKNALAARLRASGDLLDTTKAGIETVLHHARDVRAVVSRVRVVGRVKGAYSVHRKMKRSGKRLDQIYDVLALRVIIAPKHGGSDVEECEACYAVAEAIREHYPVLENREKDYLTHPKSNGYRSLHLTILAGDALQPLEVQIRTEKMHHVAEFGAAAHWLYKGDSSSSFRLSLQNELFRKLPEQYEQPGVPYPRPRIPLNLGSAAEADAKRKGYVTHIADAIRQSRIIVKSCGQLYTLAIGSTLSDFLSGLGMMSSLGAVAVVNGSVAPLTQRLEMNDIINFTITAVQEL